MAKKKFLCLARSRKNNQWCVAGVNSAGQWIRLVNPGGGELSNKDITDKDGNMPNLLETWEVEVVKKEPLYFQPENWVIDQSKCWRYSANPIYPNLDDFLDDEDYIFLNASDRLSASLLEEKPIHKSLMLIYVDDLLFQKTTNSKNRVQVRAKFEYNDNHYDLVVADTECEALFKGGNALYRAFRDYSFTGGYYLGIGLGEKFKGYHFK